MRFARHTSHLLLCLMLLVAISFGQQPAVDSAASIKDFGAECDGKTDDTDAFARAIKVLSRSPHRLTLPEGVCRVTGPIRIPTPMVHITGLGNGSVIEADFSSWRSPSDLAVLQILNTDAWVSTGRVFRDFSIRGKNNTKVKTTGILIRSLNNWADGGHYIAGVLVENVHVGEFDTGVEISDITRSLFRFVQADRCRIAFVVRGEAVNTQFENVYGVNFSREHTSSLESTVGILFDQREYPDKRSRGPEGVWLSRSVFLGAETNLLVRKGFFITADHNIFDFASGDGVVIEDPNTFRLEDNYISTTQPARAAILVRSPTEHIDGLFITGNYINGLGKKGTIGVRFEKGKHRRGLTLARNQFISLDKPIYLESAVESGHIRDNYGSANSGPFITIEGDEKMDSRLMIDGNISSDRADIISTRAKGFSLGANSSATQSTGKTTK
jgi:hypothetical protein